MGAQPSSTLTAPPCHGVVKVSAWRVCPMVLLGAPCTAHFSVWHFVHMLVFCSVHPIIFGHAAHHPLATGQGGALYTGGTELHSSE
eukprot:CAMPEP_0177234540 /NCGR_PEP_ID=MMETSP0367-20130122/44448_1 /TAXON_ID=447022 ORGANISM="Scrippsiella hangoei-like, Strain SHHI-4" /NCGR_SAMPLE_ID=MMETSP0367 /ASSEMBLY_ACC=CAM_ASM_000362 /LENGTH=85 /DNA_ID=CAMNT_0018685335 /DNA_START=36 /DNA_END=290 /DNA_ORIENTATION=+